MILVRLIRIHKLPFLGALIVLIATTVQPWCRAFLPYSASYRNVDNRSWRSLGGPRVRSTEIYGLFGRKATGPPVILDIPAKDVKIGALRFFLQIHLVGSRNQPEPNSWLTKQGENGELQIYYKDGTGMISLELEDYGIKAIRYGEKPSLQYVLQESILLHGILDELDTVAFDVGDIAEEKRLLRLNDPQALVKAREKLPARKE